jgi:mRNA interferase MazF
MPTPSRGEIWTVDLDPVVGHEQAGRRPALVVSVDKLNHSSGELAIVCPITKRDRRNPMHVRIEPPEGGVRVVSFVKCEAVRSVSTQRLGDAWGYLEASTMVEVAKRLRGLLKL